MNKNPKHRISNSYSRKKHIREFDGYKVTSYTSTISQNTPQLEQLEKEDQPYLRLKKKVEGMYTTDKTFKLYSRISSNLNDTIKDSAVLRKVRQTECQLLKLLLLSSLSEMKNTPNQRKNMITHNVTKQNSISGRPQTFQATTGIKRQRLHPRSFGESAFENFEKFKMTESIKRLETQLEKIPQIDARLTPSATTTPIYSELRKQFQMSKSSQNRLTQELVLKDLRLQYLVQQISNLQQSKKQLQQELKLSRQMINDLSQKLAYYQKNLQFQELWRMSNEEITTLRINKLQLERQLRHLNKKYKLNKDRLMQVIKSQSSGIMDDAKQDMQDLKFLISELNHGFKHKEIKGIKTEEIMHKLPNILVLFDQDKLKQNTNNTKTIGSDFFLKLRGIMDSKYSQFWSNCEPKNSLNLSDFTMGFLDKFTIDTKFKKITINGSNSDLTQKNKLQFIMNLSSTRLKDVIEISLFKQFLYDQRTRDELFFFLSCRHVLFNGHVLDNAICSQDPIIFVPLQRAFKIIDQILTNFDKTLTDRIKQSLNLKRKKKAHKFFIDGHFLLKALLQLYSLERKKKLSIFKKSMVVEDPNQKPVVFKTFKRFINKNYNFVTNSEISELYRSCWKLTKGSMQIQTLFNMCDWIFVQQLKDQIFLPKRFNNEYKQTIKRVQQHFQEGKYFTRRVQQLGNEKILLQSQKLKKLLQNINSKDLLNVQHLFSMMTLLQLPKTVKTVEMLGISASYKLSKIPYLNEDDFRISQFQQLTSINSKNEDYRRNLKEAAEKIGMYFDMKIKILYKRFGADINKQLVDLSIVLP